MRVQDKPKPGVLNIAAGGEMQIKICWKYPGDINALCHSIRDNCITDPQAIIKRATELDFGDLLIITRKSRFTAAGEGQEPPQPDNIRKAFGDTPDSPYGKGTQLFMDLTSELAARK